MYFSRDVISGQDIWSKRVRFVIVAIYACVLTVGCLFFLACSEANAKGVYEGQPPLTDKELVSFIELLPHFRAWAIPNDIKANPTVNKSGRADFIYSDKAAKWVIAKGWEPARFFTVMGRAAAALAVIEEGNDLLTRRPTDMPTVTDEELYLVRRHLGSLLKAGSDAPPFK